MLNYYYYTLQPLIAPSGTGISGKTAASIRTLKGTDIVQE